MSKKMLPKKQTGQRKKCAENAHERQEDIWIGKAIRHLRKKRNLSQVEVSKQLGISYQQVQKYETGQNRISAAMMFRLASILGVNIHNFYQFYPEYILCAVAEPVRVALFSPQAQRLAILHDKMQNRIFQHYLFSIAERTAILETELLMHTHK